MAQVRDRACRSWRAAGPCLRGRDGRSPSPGAGCPRSPSGSHTSAELCSPGASHNQPPTAHPLGRTGGQRRWGRVRGRRGWSGGAASTREHRGRIRTLLFPQEVAHVAGGVARRQETAHVDGPKLRQRGGRLVRREGPGRFPALPGARSPAAPRRAPACGSARRCARDRKSVV